MIKILNKKEKIQFAVMSVFLVIGIFAWVYLIRKDIYFSRAGMPECFIHYITGYYCPGCGGTRAFDCFIHGQWIRSFFYHPAVLVAFILFMNTYIRYVISKFKNDRKYVRAINLGTVIYIDFFILAWFLLRNLYVYVVYM